MTRKRKGDSCLKPLNNTKKYLSNNKTENSNYTTLMEMTDILDQKPKTEKTNNGRTDKNKDLREEVGTDRKELMVTAEAEGTDSKELMKEHKTDSKELTEDENMTDSKELTEENMTDSKELMEDENMTDSKELTEDENMTVSKELMEDENMTDSKELTEDENMTDSKELMEDENMTDSKELTEEENMTDSKELTEDENMTDSKELTENENMTDSKELTEDENMTDSKELTEENMTDSKELMEDENMTEELTKDENMTDSKELTEDENMTDSKELTEDENMTDSKELMEDENMTDSKELTEDENMTDSKELMEDENMTDSKELTEEENMTDSKELTEDENMTDSKELTEDGTDRKELTEDGTDRKELTEEEKETDSKELMVTEEADGTDKKELMGKDGAGRKELTEEDRTDSKDLAEAGTDSKQLTEEEDRTDRKELTEEEETDSMELKVTEEADETDSKVEDAKQRKTDNKKILKMLFEYFSENKNSVDSTFCQLKDIFKSTKKQMSSFLSFSKIINDKEYRYCEEMLMKNLLSLDSLQTSATFKHIKKGLTDIINYLLKKLDNLYKAGNNKGVQNEQHNENLSQNTTDDCLEPDTKNLKLMTEDIVPIAEDTNQQQNEVRSDSKDTFENLELIDTLSPVEQVDNEYSGPLSKEIISSILELDIPDNYFTREIPTSASFVIEEGDMKKLLSNRSVRSFKRDTWESLFFRKVKESNPYCSFQVTTSRLSQAMQRRRKPGSPFFSANAHCTFSDCNIKLHLEMQDTKVVNVTYSGRLKHDINEIRQRPIKGADRDSLKQHFKGGIKPLSYFLDQLQQLSPESLVSGNRDGLGKNSQVYAQIAAESRQGGRMDENVLLSLQELKEEMKRKQEGGLFKKYVPPLVISCICQTMGSNCIMKELRRMHCFGMQQAVWLGVKKMGSSFYIMNSPSVTQLKAKWVYL